MDPENFVARDSFGLVDLRAGIVSDNGWAAFDTTRHNQHGRAHEKRMRQGNRNPVSGKCGKYLGNLARGRTRKLPGDTFRDITERPAPDNAVERQDQDARKHAHPADRPVDRLLLPSSSPSNAMVATGFRRPRRPIRTSDIITGKPIDATQTK